MGEGTLQRIPRLVGLVSLEVLAPPLPDEEVDRLMWVEELNQSRSWGRIHPSEPGQMRVGRADGLAEVNTRCRAGPTPVRFLGRPAMAAEKERDVQTTEDETRSAENESIEPKQRLRQDSFQRSAIISKERLQKRDVSLIGRTERTVLYPEGETQGRVEGAWMVETEHRSVLDPAFLVSARLYLRPLEKADLQGPWLGWLNDYQVTRFLETGTFPTTPETLTRYFNSVTQSHDNVMFAIISSGSDQHIGNIKLGPIDHLHRRAELAILIGNTDYWGKGYGREAWNLMVSYAFDRLNLHKITLGVYADHEAAVRLYESVGFKIEGILHEHLFRDGCYHDKYVMGLLKKEYGASTVG